MSFCYECCICNSSFKIEDAVDGFKQGYTQGFLCLKCGGNIEESAYPESHPEHKMLATEWLGILSFCYAAYVYVQSYSITTDLVIAVVAFVLFSVVSRVIKSGKNSNVLLQTIKVNETKKNA